MTGKHQAQNVGQGLFPARKQEPKNEQNTDENSDNGRDNPESDNGQNSSRFNRTVFDGEVKNDDLDGSKNGLDSGGNLPSLPMDRLADFRPIRPSGLVGFGVDETRSARLYVPANQASFDAGKYSLPHVQNEQENNQSATCAKSPEVEVIIGRLTGRELAKWAIENFAVDPIKSSKNRWKIRIRCRGTGCKHDHHLGLKTVSFMSDSVFKKLTRSESKYELWKKQTIAENAGALRKSD